MDFWQLLNNFASVLQIITVIATVYTATRLWQENRRIRDLIDKTPSVEGFTTMRESHSGIKSIAPVALVLTLTPNTHSIRSSVEAFLSHMNWKMEIEELKMDGIDPATNLESFINELRKKRKLIEAKKFTEVHVFISGPIVAGALLGSLYDNWIPVKLYHKPTPAPPQVYEYWMPLL